MHTKVKGRNGGNRATPGTAFDARHSTGTDPLTDWFGLQGKPSQTPPEARLAKETEMTPAEKFLSRVEHRQTGPGRWQFRVPTRKDRHMSGSVRETDNGLLLVHDFGGDSVVDILAAIDLSLTNLFPAAITDQGKPQSRPFAGIDALRGVARDCLIVCAAAAILRENKPLSASDFAAMIAAAGRIHTAVSAVLPEMRRVRHGH